MPSAALGKFEGAMMKDVPGHPAITGTSFEVRRMRRKRQGWPDEPAAISAALAANGVTNERGMPYNPKSISAMLAG